MMEFERVIKKLEAKKKSVWTIQGYKATYRLYSEYLGGKTPTIANAESFIEDNAGRWKAATVNRHTMGIRTYFKINGKKIPKGKLDGVDGDGVDENKFVTQGQVDVMYKCANSLRDQAIVRLLYHTGMRRGELTKCKVGDIDFNQGRINIKTSKSREVKTRSCRFILPSFILPTIRAYLQQRGINPDTMTLEQKQQPLIASNDKNRKAVTSQVIYNTIIGLREVVGISELTPHWLRHGFVVWNKINGVPPELTAKQIGDSVQTTTAIYSHYKQSDVDQLYDQLEGEITVDKDTINPLDKLEELTEKNKELETKINQIPELIEEAYKQILKAEQEARV